MGFLETIKTTVTGKSQIERRQEAAANKIIRRKVIAEQLQEREKQAIRFAREKEKVIYQRKTQQLRQPPRQAPMFGQNLGFGMVSGQGQARPIRSVPINQPKYVVKKIKKRTKRTKRSRPRPARPEIVQAPQRFRII